MNNHMISRTHPVLSFAVEEWSRLLHASGTRMMTNKQLKEVWIGTWEELKVWQPDLLEKINGGEWKDTGYSDEFVIIETDQLLFLSGKSERAALYAVYQYAQETWGMQKVYPELSPECAGEAFRNSWSEETQKPVVRDQVRWLAPRMERRGFVFETINETQYLIKMIDWLAHNKINEMFFTFSLWDQVGDEIAPEIIKRGLMVTLGGHSMKFFLNKEEDKAPNPVADNPYTAKAQLNFRDGDWQTEMLQEIVEYCGKVPNLTRISMWPEDVADRQSEGFLEHYMQFTEQLKECMRKVGLKVEVEHIAYNAGLAWNMLERSDTKPSLHVDTLFAFWGRDYRYGYEESPHVDDRRAREALEDWAQELDRTDRKLTIFEYYSDHYMLSNLFPFLPRRIMKDVDYYKNLNLEGMVNLVVPYRGPDPYPWKWVHGFNSYIFCSALWSDDLEKILSDYYSSYPKNERTSVKALFEMIEAKLPEMTSWNIPLFPARAVEPEKAIVNKEQKERMLATLSGIKSSLKIVLQQAQLNPDCEAYRYGRHIIDYSENLYQRWLEK